MTLRRSLLAVAVAVAAALLVLNLAQGDAEGFLSTLLRLLRMVS